MAESDEMSRLNCCLEVSLNPIGSLALAERLDESEDRLMWTFNILSSKVVDLILSPYGFRIVESFLNENINNINVRLSECLSKKWSDLEQVLTTEKGRYVCDTLLKRKMKKFAHRMISIVPNDWWFNNAESLPILSKVISISDFDVAKNFTSSEKTKIDLCDSPEGLYCVLKVMAKSMDEPGWRDDLSRLVLLKSESIAGSEALAQAFLYGDYLLYEMVEILCCRRESYDNLTTVSLVIRLIERGSIDLKQIIAKCLCEPASHPMICQIRDTTRFEDFKLACDSNFTLSQRKRLDDLLHVSTRVRSVVDDCLTMMKRKAESPITQSQSAVKRARENVMEPQPSASSQNTVPPLSTVPTSSTVATPPTVPSTQQSPPSLSPAIPCPSAPVEVSTIQRIDPGNDMINMAMSKEYSVLLSKLNNDSTDFCLTVFDGIRSGLLQLMMDENGSKVVKWFISNGMHLQRDEIERKVEENMEKLATNGGYGRTVAQSAIDNCPNQAKRMELCMKFMKATQSSRASLSSTPASGFGNSNEIEIVSQKINKQPDEKSTVAKPHSDEIAEKIPDRWRRILREDDNGKVSIVNGRTMTDEEVRIVRQTFDEIDRQLNCKPGNINQYISTGVKQGGVSQLFIDLVQERVTRWVKHEPGTNLLYGLVQDKVLRRHLAYAVASVLHLLRFLSGNSVLSLMLLDNGTRTSFVNHCITRNEDSPLVKLFHSDRDAAHCLWIGKACARKKPHGVLALINSPLGRLIAGTVNGRMFIESLTKPPPEGFGWTDLLMLLTSPPVNQHPQAFNAARANTVATSQLDTVATPNRDTVAASIETVAAPNATPSFFFRPPIKIQSESNPFRAISPPVPFTFSIPRPPLFQSSLINISPSGTPSFPIVPRLTAQNFSFAGLNPAFVTREQAVKDTVEFIVSKVANENP